jgi:hypothetical protein
MGRRSRQRARSSAPEGAAIKGGATALTAPPSTYTDPAAGELVLRGSLTAATRRRYAETLRGGLNQEDAWQRALELLFEHLAVSWTIAGVSTDRQKELLGRYRVATAEERRFVREALRSHLEENFPELQAP